VRRIPEERTVRRLIGKIIGVISFIFGIAAIITVIDYFLELRTAIASHTTVSWVPFSYSSQFSFLAIVLGVLSYLVGREKRFGRAGIILGTIALVIMVIFAIFALWISRE